MSRDKNKSQSRRSDQSQNSKFQTTAPAKSSWRFALLIALIIIPALGLWGYLKWGGQPGIEQAAKQPNPLATETNSNLQAAKNTQASWNRPFDESTSGWVTETEQLESWQQIDNASSDGWDTEVFTSAAMKQFEKLKKVLTHGPFEDKAVEFIVAPDATIQKLLPTKLETTFHDSTLDVQRAAIIDAATNDVGGESERGSVGFAKSLRDLIAPFNDPEKTRMKFKVFRVEKESDSINTQQTVEIFGPTKDGVQEINAIWTAHWSNDLEHPVIKSISVTQYETVVRVGKTIFSECTESVVGQTEGFKNQLLQGYNHWLDQSQAQRFFDLLGAPGVAIGDVNADGLEDMYVCQESGLPNLLFLQKPDGSLVDFSRESGTDWLQNSRTALIVDLNNDDHQDLVVGVDGGVVLAQGDSSGRFSIRKVVDTSDDVMSLSAVDYDLDGRLDLYVGAYYPNEYGGESEEQAISTPGFIYYDAKTGAPNSLLRNESTGELWNFSDVTQIVGLNVNNTRYTLSASWDDVDNDGDQDLYIANDFAANNLYRNDLKPDGTRAFVDIAREADAEDTASGMSVAWGDYNRDGWMDLYVSNMFSYAGNRIMFQDQFKSGLDENAKKIFQRFARGNTLMKNLGNQAVTQALKFEDRSEKAAVNRGRWAWGSAFVDVNNDGWEDIVVANGYITTTDATGDL